MLIFTQLMTIQFLTEKPAAPWVRKTFRKTPLLLQSTLQTLPHLRKRTISLSVIDSMVIFKMTLCLRVSKMFEFPMSNLWEEILLQLHKDLMP